jgi:uncharacterized OB-fold protein
MKNVFQKAYHRIGIDILMKKAEQSVTNKKCRQCSTINTGSSNECSHCGSSLYEETCKRQTSQKEYNR